jgi:glutamate dehydrogenase
MTDVAPPAAESDATAREEILRLAEDALHRLAPALPPAAALLRPLFASVSTAELAEEAPETLAAAAISLFDLARRRLPGDARIRVLPPGPGNGSRAVAEIVTDDMPFLVDSALGALSRQGRLVHQLLHPVLSVRRDAAGNLLGEGGAADAGVAAESFMRITIGPTPAPMLPGLPLPAADDWAALEAGLARAMADVRIAVEDFPAMAALVRDAAAAATEPEAAFLRWLGEDNFVLLGHRRYRMGAAGEAAPIVVEAENLGLLRDPEVPVFDALRDLSALTPAVRAAITDPPPLTVVKANMRSTVHRPQHADVIATRVAGTDGRPAGVRLFLGLFAASAYNRNPRSIPWLSEKVDRVLAAAGLDPAGHDGRALRNILDTWPRDELFQAPEAAILAGAQRALDLQIRPRPALVTRRDAYGRFVSAIAWLPRDTFDTGLRERVGAMIARAHGGRLSAFYIALGDAPLARIHYIVATDPARPVSVDEAALQAAIGQAARGFQDRLAAALAAERGEAVAAEALARWRDAFPAGYRDEATGAQGAADIALADRALAEERPAACIDRPPGAAPTALVLRLANPGGPLPLADALPLFESLDLRAIEEHPHRLTPAGAPVVVLHVFSLTAGAPADPARLPLLLDGLMALLEGRAEADGFNRLVLRAGLTWRECWLIRVMFRWLRQVGFGFEQGSVEATLAGRPEAARLLVDLFHARLDPAHGADRAASEAALDAAWRALLDAIESPEEERILTRLRTLLDAVLRSNFHQRHTDRLALKIDSAVAGEMPAPRPWREIFVHSPRMEGVHLRAGPVARGGIRWSDRREDFRTEILGLMKAQRLKNVVIVPTGAKGGFVLKRPPADRAALQAEGVQCYSLLVRGMLDMTDTVGADGMVMPPVNVVRRDGDDPYLVVAADKGTATFSDLANALAYEYGFWLGDAFASGGSAGYDHKGMGITARGAWVMVARHFAELGQDIFAEPFTCAGVGDMSGDVFGNGLLISRRTRLVAAFDHRHIFLDPDPEPDTAWMERARLFARPGSSWADCDPAAISRGGGVFPRNARAIALSAEAQALLGLEGDRVAPAEVLRAILRAPVDLLYFGGIGTYVKAGTETHAEVGDRANDAIRVDGRTLRARVIGEGANLGLTQAGRIEAARAGIRLNTDALDNSAGVSTSDHEVNIKILLADLEHAGQLTRPQRDVLLREMTGEVAALVLRDNALQGQAVSLEEQAGAAALVPQTALIAQLESAGVLDRQVAGLPDAVALQRRLAAGDALTRPEIAALLPFAKLWLAEALEASTLPDEPALAPLLLAYFPMPLRERHADAIARHRLRRELVVTALANRVANRLGPAGLARLTAEAGPAEAARATWLAGEVFDMEAAFDAADDAPAPAGTRLEVQQALRELLEAVGSGLLGDAVLARPLAEAVTVLTPGIAALRATAAPDGVTLASWVTGGIPPEVASLAAAAPQLAEAPLILRLAAEAGAAPAAAAASWSEAGERYGFDMLRRAALAVPAPGTFGPRARAAVLRDLRQAQHQLAAALLAGTAPAGDRADAAAVTVREAAMVGDLAALTVAARALGALG